MKIKLIVAMLLMSAAGSVWAQEKPEAPKPKVASEMGKKERDAYLYKKYGDPLQIDTPVKGFREAATRRGNLIFGALFVGSGIADTVATQHCIGNHTCREGNPLLGQSKAQQIAVGGAAAALVFVAATKLRQEGHGTLALALYTIPTVLHVTFAVDAARR